MIAKKKISRILWEVWDPIGVNTIPEARDEYDDYVEEISALLRSGASDEQIACHLLHVATVTMALTGPALEDMRPTVKALRGIYPQESD